MGARLALVTTWPVRPDLAWSARGHPCSRYRYQALKVGDLISYRNGGKGCARWPIRPSEPWVSMHGCA